MESVPGKEAACYDELVCLSVCCLSVFYPHAYLRNHTYEPHQIYVDITMVWSMVVNKIDFEIRK